MQKELKRQAAMIASLLQDSGPDELVKMIKKQAAEIKFLHEEAQLREDRFLEKEAQLQKQLFLEKNAFNIIRIAAGIKDEEQFAASDENPERAKLSPM